MTTNVASPDAALLVEFVNPILRATRDVFEMMLGCTPRRIALKSKTRAESQYSVSGVIGITGRYAGTIVVCLPSQMVMGALERMTGEKVTAITPDVCDAIGELTNMIAGAAKSQLEHLQLSISLPNVICGESFDISYPSQVTPFCVLFESELGKFAIEAGFTRVS